MLKNKPKQIKKEIKVKKSEFKNQLQIQDDHFRRSNIRIEGFGDDINEKGGKTE